MKDKIVLIVPYYGSFPKTYFDIFLQSVRKNKRFINVLFVTDLDIPVGHEEYIFKIHLSFEEIKEYFKSELGFNLNLTSTRKFCDLKPTYGMVFREYIKEYKFWAFGDIDLMFGDIESFFGIINDHDVSTFHEFWVSGPFTVFRNTDKCNQLFLRSDSLKEVYTNSKYIGFDECGQKYGPLSKGMNILNYKSNSECSNDIECLTFVLENMKQSEGLSYYQQMHIKESVLLNDEILYQNKKLTFNNKELIHYHFITEKQYLRFKFPTWKELPDEFIIKHTGFYSLNQNNFFVLINFKYRILINEIYRFIGRLWLSINYRIFKRNVKLKYRINVFK